MIARVQKWLHSFFILQKMSGPLGMVLLLLTACFIAFVSARGATLSFLLLVAFAGVFFLFIVFVNPRYGFFTMLLIPFTFYEIERYTGTNSLPINSLIQAICIYLIIIILLKRKAGTMGMEEKPTRSIITWVLVFFQFYGIIQLFNPLMGSFDGWFLSFRSSLAALIVYLLTQMLIEDKKFINEFLNLWLFLALAAAMYACYQEWIGMPRHVLNYIHADPIRFNLIFVSGAYRKFSLLADPASFGIIMSASSSVFLIMGMREKRRRRKIMYMGSAIFMMLAMGYSGTRTSYVTLIASLVLYALMTINNFRTVILIAIGAIGMLVLLYGPIHGNSTVNRFRSTFDNEDASLNVRDINRKNIQPYIYSHPMGGGILTTEMLGLKYNPEHELAGFMPDGGYLKMVLETGWFGLFIYVMIFYTGLVKGIREYYRAKNHRIKTIYLALVVFLFSISIANYAQKSTFGFPIITFIFPTLAIISKLHLLDKEDEEVDANI